MASNSTYAVTADRLLPYPTRTIVAQFDLAAEHLRHALAEGDSDHT